MHRTSLGRRFASPLLLVVPLLAGCGPDNTGGGTYDFGVGGGKDLAGADLAGADLSVPPGVDLAMSLGDLAGTGLDGPSAYGDLGKSDSGGCAMGQMGIPCPNPIAPNAGCMGVEDCGANGSGNGLDDNCDGIIDNAAPLTTTADLTVALSGTSGTALSWPAVSGASAYDLLRGDDGTLVTTGGNFSQAVTSCLADNTAGLSATDAAVPQSGAAFFYLLRAVNCGGGSWEGGDPAQVGVRGPSIAASPLACP